MPATQASTFTVLASNLLEVLAQARSAEAALQQVDLFRRVVAGDSLFSIQQNVTTEQDPADVIRLQRFYSSEADRFPVQGIKRKTTTPWTECLFRRGRVFVGEGVDVLARTFDDFEQMRECGVQAVVNVPLMQGMLCYATFNVFGTRAQWLAQEVLGIQLLALATARWVPAAPGLAYRFSGAPANSPVEN
jgi:hypothetical protein